MKTIRKQKGEITLILDNDPQYPVGIHMLGSSSVYLSLEEASWLINNLREFLDLEVSNSTNDEL